MMFCMFFVFLQYKFYIENLIEKNIKIHKKNSKQLKKFFK